MAKYAITYHVNGGVNDSANPLWYTRESETIVLKAPSRAGYDFAGWYGDASYQTPVTSIEKGSSGAKELYAKWNVIRYTITYYLNGGADGGNPTWYTIESETILLKDAVYKGYAFDGWYLDEACTQQVTELKKGSMGDKVLYAKWSLRKYKITYKLNKGKNNKKNPKTYTMTDKTIKLKKATRKGYTFAGWYTDAKFRHRVEKIKTGSCEDITLYAKWKPYRYTVKFDGNGATSGKMATLRDLKYGKKYTLKRNTLKKTGYVFTGWNTKKNGKGKTYKDKAKIKNLTAKNKKTVVLYAQWKKKK